MTQFISIETRQTVGSADADRLDRIRAAAAALDRIGRELPATWTLMRDNMSGHPRASAAGTGAGPSPWCWAHGRTIAECERDDELCAGEVITGPSDPTGTAALAGDRADRDRREMNRRLDKAAQLIREAEAIAAGYPGVATETEGAVPGPGDGFCRACWLDGQEIREVTLDAKGHPYYKGLCRRCGQWRSKLGGDPPTWFVHRLNHKQEIKPWHVRRASDQVAASNPKPGKKGRSKKARKPSGPVYEKVGAGATDTDS